MTFRGFLMWVHLVLGLTGALILTVVGVTGVYITFQGPLHSWLDPEPAIPEFTGQANLVEIVRIVEARFPSRRVARVDVRSHEATLVTLRDRTRVFVDPHRATILGVREPQFASIANLTAVMRRLHTNLLIGHKGRLLVAFATAETILLALTGIWLWWRKKQWRLGKLRGSPYRVSWDLHNATGLWFLVPALCMSITGLLMAFPQSVHRLVGPTARYPGPPPSATSASPMERPTLQAILSRADSALPTGPATTLIIPGTPRPAYTLEKPGGTVFLDQYSGSVIEVRPEREPSAGDRALRTTFGLHTGIRFGVPGVVVMTLGSIMLAVMAITGLILGWKRLLILFGKLTE